MNSRYLLSAVVTAAVALAVNTATAQNVERTRRPGPTRPIPPDGLKAKGPATRNVIDIRGNVKRLFAENRVRPGKNLVHTAEDGVKLYAVSSNGRVTGWEATDKSGKSLPVRYNQGSRTTSKGAQVTCTVCIIVVVEADVPLHRCYEIDCSDLPQPKDRK